MRRLHRAFGLGDPRQSGNTRRLVRWQDLTLALAVVVACIGYLALGDRGGTEDLQAAVYLDSSLVMRLPLDGKNPGRVDLMESYGVPVSLETADGAIRFVEVTCPDHICEKTGWISQDGQTAVCMPNRVAVKIETGEM